jgi:hypothetical protein
VNSKVYTYIFRLSCGEGLEETGTAGIYSKTRPLKEAILARLLITGRIKCTSTTWYVKDTIVQRVKVVISNSCPNVMTSSGSDDRGGLPVDSL